MRPSNQVDTVLSAGAASLTSHDYSVKCSQPFRMYFFGTQSGSAGGGGGGRSTGGLGPLRLLSLCLRMSSGLKGAGPDGSLGLGFGAAGCVWVGVVFLGPTHRSGCMYIAYTCTL